MGLANGVSCTRLEGNAWNGCLAGELAASQRVRATPEVWLPQVNLSTRSDASRIERRIESWLSRCSGRTNQSHVTDAHSFAPPTRKRTETARSIAMTSPAL